MVSPFLEHSAHIIKCDYPTKVETVTYKLHKYLKQKESEDPVHQLSIISYGPLVH